MAGLANFISRNTKATAGEVGKNVAPTGLLGKVFLLGYIKEILTADNKTKALLKTFKDLALFRVTLAAGFIGLFGALGKLVQGLVRDTGSLEAAMRRLGQVQGFQRQFAPLVGGLAAAKQRLSELLTLAQRSKGAFKFEELAGASRSLQVAGRGGFAGGAAVAEIGKAALGSGNSIEATADAVGNFYDVLRSGQPVGAAAEQLRQMGLISQHATDQLTALAAGGASVGQVFDELRGDLGKLKPELDDHAQGVDAVNAAYTAAKENLAVKFGQPFTEDEIQNTKNYRDAMLAIGPATARVAGFLAILVDGLSTVKSSLTKTAAESKLVRGALEGAVYVIGTLAAALAVGTAALSAYRLATLAATGAMGSFTAGAGLLGTAWRLAAGAGAIGLVVVAIATLVGITVGVVHAQERARQKVMELTKAHREAAAAIDAQIAAMETLTDRHEALAAAAQKVLDLQEQLNKQPGLIDRLTGAAGKQKGETQRALNEARETLEKLAGRDTRGLASPERAALSESVADLSLGREESGGTESRQAVLSRRAAQGRRGLEARVAVAETRSKLEGEKVIIQTGIARMKALGFKDLTGEEKLRQINERILAAGTGFGSAKVKGTSIELETRALMLEKKGGSGAEIQALRQRAQRAAKIEASTAQNQLEADQIAKDRRGRAAQEDLGLGSRAARRRGRFQEAVGLSDLESFGAHFQEQLSAGFSREDAKARAVTQTKDDILESIANRPAVVDSLQSIGGGGNLAGADPMLDYARRQTEFQEKMTIYLEIISGRNSPTRPYFSP